jgi:hypothetical protein
MRWVGVMGRRQGKFRDGFISGRCRWMDELSPSLGARRHDDSRRRIAPTLRDIDLRATANLVLHNPSQSPRNIHSCLDRRTEAPRKVPLILQRHGSRRHRLVYHADHTPCLQAFLELAKGERTAAALESHLDSLESKIEALLAKAEEDSKTLQSGQKSGAASESTEGSTTDQGDDKTV